MHRVYPLLSLLLLSCLEGRPPAADDAAAGARCMDGGPCDAGARDAAPASGAHAGHDAQAAPAARDAAPVDDGAATGGGSLLERGEYLVRHVSGCMECHTPRTRGGLFDRSRLLAGVENLHDLVPEDDARGAIHSRNLTPHEETGLGNWTDEEIKDAFLHGMAPDGRVLHWTMPYWLYHEMSERDADAVVAYLRSIPPVEHELPDRQPLPLPPERAVHLPHGSIPQTTLAPTHPDYARAQHGRYLATAVGICPYCHSPESADPALPVDLERVFMGRRAMVPVALGASRPEDSPTIETRNLTPHETGLGEWSTDDVFRAVVQGVSRSGLPVCDPMPSTYGASFRGMTEQDARDIGLYLTTLTPRDSGEIEYCCSACHGDTDGGVPGLTL